MKKHVLGLLVFFLSGMAYVNASHLMGGYFNWEYINKDTIKVYATFMADCNSSEEFRTNENFNCWSGNICKYYKLTKLSTTDITPLCSNQCSACSGGSCSIKYGIKEIVYAGYLIVSDFSKSKSCSLSLYMNKGNMPTSVTNVIATSPSVLYAEIDMCTNTYYSIPRFKVQNQMICSGSAVNMDLYPDGPVDILSFNFSLFHMQTSYYRICDPSYIDSYLGYNKPFKYNKPLTFQGFPKSNLALPAGFHLDSLKGTLQFTPTKLEFTFIGIEVKIYNGSTLLGSLIQSIGLIVTKCPNNKPPVISGYNCKTPSTQSFDFYTCADKPICFSVCTSDANNGDSVQLSYSGYIPGASFTITNTGGKRDTGEFCWTPDTSQISEVPYYFSLTAKDNKCPIPGTYTQVYRVYVGKKDTAQLHIKIDTLDNCGKYQFTLLDKDSAYLHDIEWYLNDSIKLGEGSIAKYTFTGNGNYTLKAIYQGCKMQIARQNLAITGLKPIKTNPIGDTLLCANELLALNLQASGGAGKLSYNWSFPGGTKNIPINNDSMGILVSFKNSTTETNYNFNYTITDSIGCKLGGTHTVLVKGYQWSEIERGTKICNSSAQNYPLKLDNNTSGWYGNGVKNDTFYNTLADKGEHIIYYRNITGSICTVDSAIIKSFASANVQAGADFGLCISAGDTLLSALPKGGLWSGAFIDANNYFNPAKAQVGNHNLVYFATDSNGCSNTDTLTISVKDYKPTLSVTDSVKACVNGNLIEMEALPKGGKWTASGFTSNNNIINVNPKIFGAGRYSFIYNYVDENKCANADTALAIIYDLPKPAFTVDSVVKQGDTLKITNQSTVVHTAKTIYTWIISAPTNKTANGFEPSIIMDSLGLHSITLIATDNKTTCTDTLFVANSVEVVLKTAIQLGKIAGLSVYPNPFSQELNFSNTTGQTLHYQLFTQEGKMVYNKSSQDKTINLDLNYLAKGVYTLKVSGNGLSETQQIIKK